MADVVSFMIAPQSGKVYVSIVGALYTPEELRALCFQLVNAARQSEDIAQQANGGLIVPNRVLAPNADA